MSKAIIIYETRSGNTKLMADAVQDGLKRAGVDVVVKKIDDVSIDELAGYDSVILGAPTYHADLIPTMKTFLFKLEKANLKDKVGAAFGAYGWSGESVEMLSGTMKHIYGMDMYEPEEKLMGTAAKVGQGVYRNFGKSIAEKILARKPG